MLALGIFIVGCTNSTTFDSATYCCNANCSSLFYLHDFPADTVCENPVLDHQHFNLLSMSPYVESTPQTCDQDNQPIIPLSIFESLPYFCPRCKSHQCSGPCISFSSSESIGAFDEDWVEQAQSLKHSAVRGDISYSLHHLTAQSEDRFLDAAH